jgi:hypothetical protein
MSLFPLRPDRPVQTRRVKNKPSCSCVAFPEPEHPDCHRAGDGHGGGNYAQADRSNTAPSHFTLTALNKVENLWTQYL